MLMLTGVVTEITNGTSPRMPGSHYKIAVDASTAARVRVLLNTESVTAEMSEEMSDQLTDQMFGEANDEEELKHDPFGRN